MIRGRKRDQILAEGHLRLINVWFARIIRQEWRTDTRGKIREGGLEQFARPKLIMFVYLLWFYCSRITRSTLLLQQNWIGGPARRDEDVPEFNHGFLQLWEFLILYLTDRWASFRRFWSTKATLIIWWCCSQVTLLWAKWGEWVGGGPKSTFILVSMMFALWIWVLSSATQFYNKKVVNVYSRVEQILGRMFENSNRFLAIISSLSFRGVIAWPNNRFVVMS